MNGGTVAVAVVVVDSLRWNHAWLEGIEAIDDCLATETWRDLHTTSLTLVDVMRCAFTAYDYGLASIGSRPWAFSLRVSHALQSFTLMSALN